MMRDNKDAESGPEPGLGSASISRLRDAIADRYDIREVIREGSVATVFRAVDARHGRSVAIKVLKPEMSVAIGARRFQREIELLAELVHPNILTLIDSGEAAGSLFYVTPHIAGQSLRERLDRDRQLPVEESVRIALQVADGLAYAHGRNVVHRDIRPGNILFMEGHAVIADFGLAKMIEGGGGDRLTAAGVSVGSLSYASPEQLEGEDRIDGRTDIYALGSVLFEMLTGGPPLPANPDAATILRFAEEGPPSARAIRPSISASLDTAIRRSLSRLPADRFASAGEFARSIREAARADTGPQDSSPASGPADGRRLSAVFALDMASYSRLVERDEAGTLARHRELRAAIIDPAIGEFRGRIVKGTGDGLLAEFTSAVEAVECAVRIQDRMSRETRQQTDEDGIRYRIGINVGDVVAADGDIFGAGVNIAARVESLAIPGGVAISENVYMQVRNQVPYSFEDLGPVTLKNLEQPVRVFRLTEGLRGAGSGLTESKSAWRRLVERARGR